MSLTSYLRGIWHQHLKSFCQSLSHVTDNKGGKKPESEYT